MYNSGNSVSILSKFSVHNREREWGDGLKLLAVILACIYLFIGISVYFQTMAEVVGRFSHARIPVAVRNFDREAVVQLGPRQIHSSARIGE